ncbi:hypothetical protein [Paraburkholderia caffeinilytica]|uniref:Nmad2 family putative nucleotide modification protein n=1 Tax=Paraburkholderia caffeinilytica TaxID=1761016 RepID=UPI0013BEA4A0|nr:hypothetical protein [Paraburkholderia caffeinilytica]
MKIYSYVIPRDFGFAPNPFYGTCTLATCKPKIRKAARLNDIIIGTRSAPNVHKLVFFMQVQEILTYDVYWNDERFFCKRPNLYGSKKAAFGDNIYHRDDKKLWIQEDSHHTNTDGSRCQENVDTDTSCENVLISQNFCYWGSNGPTLPSHLYQVVKKGIGHKSKFSGDFVELMFKWLDENDRGCLGKPLSWQ